MDLSQTYQFVDNLTMIRGRHAMKMGGDVRRMMGDATSTNAAFGASISRATSPAMPPRRSCSAFPGRRALPKAFRLAASANGGQDSTSRTTGG